VAGDSSLNRRPGSRGERARDGSGAGGGRRWAWLLAYAAATFFFLPQRLPGGAVLDLGLALGVAAPALWLMGLAGLGPRHAARVGFAAAWLAHAGAFYWLYVATVRHGGAAPWLGVAAPAALALFPALIISMGARACAWAWFTRAGRASPLVAALLWVAMDHVRGSALGGFPWATLGYSQHANPTLLPVASVTGVLGLTFVTALAGAALWRAATGGPRRSWGLALAFVALVHALGVLAISKPLGEGEVVRIAAIQGNIEQGVKWSPEWGARTLDTYEAWTREAAAQGARLIVWPETAVPGALELDEASRERLSALARETGAALVVGSVGVELDPAGDAVLRFFDSAFVIAADGRSAGRYDKSKLVPFGEYVPFRPLLGSFVTAMARGVATGDVSAGARPRTLELAARAPPLDRRPEEGGGDPVAEAGPDLRLGIAICYEVLFPEIVRLFVADGAGVLLAITNDAWYGRSGAPHQLLAMTAVRAAETGVWIVRAANTGVSAIIDARGRVRDETEIFEAGFVIGDVPVMSPDTSRSFYVRHGDWFARVCWLGLGGLALSAHRQRRKTLRDTEEEGHDD